MQQLEDMQTDPPRNIPLSTGKDQLRNGFLSPDSEEKYETFSCEMIQRFAGPIPAKTFISAFLPVNMPCGGQMSSDYTSLKAIFASDSTFTKEHILTALVSGELT